MNGEASEQATIAMRAREGRGASHLALLLGITAVATSGPFFLRAEMSAYAAVFWRTLFGALLGLGIAAARGVLDGAQLRANARGLVLGGVLLGPHFLLWIKAFELTDYASNQLLLVAQPVSGALLARALGEPLPRRALPSLLLAVLGMSLVAGYDLSLGPRALLGDLLCVVTCVLGSLFYVAARGARAALPLDAYMGVTLGVACLTVLPVALLSERPLVGYPASSWGWLAAIVVISTFTGHGLLNLAARTESLFIVNMSVVLEPILAIGLGVLLLGAAVSAAQVAGGILLIAAVVLLLLPREATGSR